MTPKNHFEINSPLAAPPQIKGITIVFFARYDTSHESHVYYYLATN